MGEGYGRGAIGFDSGSFQGSFMEKWLDCHGIVALEIVHHGGIAVEG
jgi:hypothetical protein